MAAFTKKEVAKISEVFGDALAGRNVDLQTVLKRCAKFWGITRDTDEYEEYVEIYKGDDVDKQIDYIIGFSPFEGDDGQLAFYDSIIKAKLITKPKNWDELTGEPEPAPTRTTKSRKATEDYVALSKSIIGKGRGRPRKEVDDEPPARGKRTAKASREEEAPRRGRSPTVDFDTIEKAVEKAGGNVAAAAEKLGLAPNTVYGRLRRGR